MSYAKALVSMSRGVIAPVTSEPIHEEHVEAEAPVMPAAQTPAGVAAAAAAPSVAMERPHPQRDEVVASTHASMPPIEDPATPVERTRDALAPASLVPEPPPGVATHTIERERVVVVPAAPAWLADDPSAPDPLVASADTDALRDLLRSVRQWTSSAPTIVAPEPATPTEPTVASPTAVDPVQVAIGNVVITVDDAPAPSARGTTRAAPARAASDRLARNHIRGT